MKHIGRITWLVVLICALLALAPFALADGCEHSNTEWLDEEPATCTEEGREAGEYCYDCQQFISGGEVIDALDHDDTTQTNSNKAVLFASFKDASGATQKINLKHDQNGWYLSLSGKGVPAGALVTVNAVFSEPLIPVSSPFTRMISVSSTCKSPTVPL